jgi:hypothetical protein
VVIAIEGDGSVAGIQLGVHCLRATEGAGVPVLESIRDAIDVIEENHRVVESGSEHLRATFVVHV